MAERPKPPIPRPGTPTDVWTPRPPAKSDPGLVAAGLERPRARSHHEINEQLAAHQKEREGEAIASLASRVKQNEDVIEAFKRYCDLQERRSERLEQIDAAIIQALRLEGKLPPELRTGTTDPPPAAAVDAKRSKSKRPPAPALAAIEADSLKAKVATYAVVILTIAKIAMDVFHLGGH